MKFPVEILKFPVDILTHIKLLYNPMVNKVFTSLHFTDEPLIFRLNPLLLIMTELFFCRSSWSQGAEG